MTDQNSRWWWQKGEKKEPLEKLNLYWDPGRNKDFIQILKSNKRVVGEHNNDHSAKDSVDESQMITKDEDDRSQNQNVGQGNYKGRRHLSPNRAKKIDKKLEEAF